MRAEDVKIGMKVRVAENATHKDASGDVTLCYSSLAGVVASVISRPDADGDVELKNVVRYGFAHHSFLTPVEETPEPTPGGLKVRKVTDRNGQTIESKGDNIVVTLTGEQSIEIPKSILREMLNG